VQISSPSESKTFVSLFTPGLYDIELAVTDAIGLTSKDSIQINAVLSDSFDLDVDITGTYEYADNTQICPWDCYFADEVVIRASGTTPVGDLNVLIWEDTDTATHSYQAFGGYATFRLSDTEYAGGNSSFDFKKLIQQGGGSFSGSINLEGGSVQNCNIGAFTNLPPLIISGTLDIQNRVVKMRLKGKILF